MENQTKKGTEIACLKEELAVKDKVIAGLRECLLDAQDCLWELDAWKLTKEAERDGTLWNPKT